MGPVLLSSAAFFVPLCVLLPISMFYLNSDVVDVPPRIVLILFACVGLSLAGVHAGVVYSLPKAWSRRATGGTLALALALYAQAHVFSIRSQFTLRGGAVDTTPSGISMPVELVLLAAIVTVSFFTCLRYAAWTSWISGALLVASAVSITPDIYAGYLAHRHTGMAAQTFDQFDETVFGFSSSHNIVHLMPDAVQSDVAMEVLTNNRELARRFDGFVFFAAHLGSFPGTAPTLPTVFNGETYDLSRGYVASEVMAELREKSFVNLLSANGVRLDFAPIVPLVCVGHVSSCVSVSFNDFRSRGYNTTRQRSRRVGVGLLADLTLFRLAPSGVKQYIYDEGRWLISGRVAEQGIDYTVHAPVLEEWRTDMYVSDDQPRYKWYHWIGAHVPHQWDRHCNYLGLQEASRTSSREQTECALSRVAMFIERLQELGIYDSTMIVLNADHGSNEPPHDMRYYVANDTFRLNEIGSSRPLFMLKPFSRRGELMISSAQTSLIDVAPTILEAFASPHAYEGRNVLTLSETERRTLEYHRYNPSEFRWEARPVPFDRFIVRGDPRDWRNWMPLPADER